MTAAGLDRLLPFLDRRLERDVGQILQQPPDLAGSVTTERRPAQWPRPAHLGPPPGSGRTTTTTSGATLASASTSPSGSADAAVSAAASRTTTILSNRPGRRL